VLPEGHLECVRSAPANWVLDSPRHGIRRAMRPFEAARQWELWGLVGTLSPALAVLLMILKPVLPSL
jgi:hypothetical protein